MNGPEVDHCRTQSSNESMTARSGETLQLLRRWHGGDREALASLVQEHLDWVHQHVRRKLDGGLRKKFESVDLVQNAMVQVLELGPQFEVSDAEHFRALLARIVTNDIRDGHRWMNRQRRDQGRERGLARDSVLHLDAPEQQVTRPSERADREERRNWVRLALELLGEEDRLLIQARQYDEESFVDIGERLGVAADAARMRHNRALKKLAEKVLQLRSGGAGAALGD